MNAIIDRLRATLGKAVNGDEYQQLVVQDEEDVRSSDITLQEALALEQTPFSWIEYGVFLVLGIAMLWAWNMFLAASTYFASRFQSNAWIFANYQSSILSISTIANLGSMFLLTNLQAGASYPRRIIWALVIDILTFTFLAASTVLFTDVSAAVYFVFVLATVLTTSIATGLLQNGALAFVATFSHPSYMQAIMTGQAVAGVLPAIAQIVFVAAASDVTPSDANTDPTAPPLETSSDSAYMYFMTATLVASLSLLAFIPLARRHANNGPDLDTSPAPARKVVSMKTLYRQIPSYSAAIMLCFALTMFFPVYTAKITSVNTPPTLRPEIFIPLAFLIWNSGDLLGRLATALPLSAAHRPLVLVSVACARVIFLPLYVGSNVAGRGAWVSSDLWYFIVVQLGFGLSNGWLASSTMMGATEAVREDEREAAGAFMGFNLVAGLTVGSLMSFAAI